MENKLLWGEIGNRFVTNRRDGVEELWKKVDVDGWRSERTWAMNWEGKIRILMLIMIG